VKLRNLIPQLLLAALTVLVGLAAWFAVSRAPSARSASPLLTAAIAATAKSGTAQFLFSMSTTSANLPSNSTGIGFGTIDFTKGASDIVTRTSEHATESTDGGPARTVVQIATTEDIDIGRALYQRIDFGAPDLRAGWFRFPSASPGGPLGPLASAVVDSAVSPLIGRATDATFIPDGRATVAGVPTERYRRVPAIEECTVTGPKGSLGRTAGQVTIWIDRQGRIRQVRATSEVQERVPGQISRGFAQTATLTFESFGRPVSIAAPTDLLHPSGQGVAVPNSGTKTSCNY
jgi:hypothetical protein